MKVRKTFKIFSYLLKNNFIKYSLNKFLLWIVFHVDHMHLLIVIKCHLAHYLLTIQNTMDS